MVKIIKCPECGSDKIRYHEDCESINQKVEVDAEGITKYGEPDSIAVRESYFECISCGNIEYSVEEIIADAEVPVKFVCPACKREPQHLTKQFEPLAFVDVVLYPADSVGGYSVEDMKAPRLCFCDEVEELYKCPECHYATADVDKFIQRVRK